MIEGRQQRSAVLLRAQPVEAHGIEPLEDVAAFPVLRGLAVLHKPLDVLEAGDDPLLARRAPALLLGEVELGEFFRQLVEIGVTLTGPPS
jgi:hypothetical protein